MARENQRRFSADVVAIEVTRAARGPAGLTPAPAVPIALVLVFAGIVVYLSLLVTVLSGEVPRAATVRIDGFIDKPCLLSFRSELC